MQTGRFETRLDLVGPERRPSPNAEADASDARLDAEVASAWTTAKGRIDREIAADYTIVERGKGHFGIRKQYVSKK